MFVMCGDVIFSEWLIVSAVEFGIEIFLIYKRSYVY